jgi:hypothetical protein
MGIKRNLHISQRVQAGNIVRFKPTGFSAGHKDTAFLGRLVWLSSAYLVNFSNSANFFSDTP